MCDPVSCRIGVYRNDMEQKPRKTVTIELLLGLCYM